MVGARPPARIWAWAPGTSRTSRVAAGGGMGAERSGGGGPVGMSPKRFSTCASTSRARTRPLTARNISVGT